MSRPRALSGLAAALGFSVLAAATAAAQPTALIIGNSNYSNFSNLPDAVADATMLAETLGFTSFPLVSRRLVSIDGVCIVEPEPVDDCD